MRIAALGALFTLAAACDSSDSLPRPSGSGGMVGTGGGSGEAGSPAATGGVAGTGGARGTGGALGTGGGGGTTGAAGTGGAAGTAGGSGGTAGGAGAAGAGASCDPRTQITMATHEILSVTWPAGAATLEGSGQVHLWGKMMFTASGNALSGSIRPCGTVLPATDLNPLIGGGKIVIDVPPAAWDTPAEPPVQVNATQTGWDVGSSISYTYAALIGFAQTGAAAAPWPASYADLTMTHDFDGDMNPGVTGVPRSGGGYLLPPTSALAAVGSGPRADKLYLVDRNVASVVLTRTSCDAAEGAEMFMHFDNHVMGCHVSGAGECSPSQVQFIDDNRTIYTVTSAVSKATTVASEATCADIRKALPM